MEFLAGDSEVVFLLALAGWRFTPFALQAPRQGEQQRELQQGLWPHFPRDLLRYFIIALCRLILSALCLLEKTRVLAGGGGLRGAVTSSLESTLERGKERLSSAPLA